MIAWITGKNRGIRNGSIIVEVGGIGYKVSVSAYVLGKVAGTEEVSFHIHTHVREDVLALYGFLSEDELTVFEALISVSGIGPKAALGILSIADTDTIRTAIVQKDPSLLTQVSGVGKKTAERVIVELQNKVAAPTNAGGRATTADGDAIEALLSLGYKVSEARDALKAVPEGVKDVGEKVRAALRLLGKKAKS
ncbi:MAG: Holliday junction branch migration protein RuvA [Candidatus Moraniibacteriota bacterium]